MKKILIYVDSTAPAGGIERVIANLSNEWIKKYEVMILVKDNGNSFYDLDERILVKSMNSQLNLNMKNRFSRMISFIKSIFLSHFSLKKILSNENPHFIYTSNPLNSLEIFLLGREYTKRLIISEHGSKLGYNKVYNFLKSIVYPKAYKISVPTKMDTEMYIEEGYPALYIPHMSTFEVKEMNNLDTNIVLNIGRLTSDKQQIKLLKIWNSLKDKSKLDNWKLKIIGKGEEKENLEQFILEHQMEDSVEIVEPTPNVEVLFKQASIFAFTSRFEGFGMVLLEAMSFGIPCISFDCPSGPRDIISNGVNGYLVENNNVEEYLKKLEILIKNRDSIRNRMGQNAFRTVRDWDNDKILSEWDKLFRRK